METHDSHSNCYLAKASRVAACFNHLNFAAGRDPLWTWNTCWVGQPTKPTAKWTCLTSWLSFQVNLVNEFLCCFPSQTGIFAVQRECVPRKQHFTSAPHSSQCPPSLQSSGEASLLSWTCLSRQVKWLVHPLSQAWFTLNRNVALHEWHLKTSSFPERENKLMDLRKER